MEESKELKFPEGFLWGSATASYQVEGGIENNDWSSQIPCADRACDSYNRYEEDFDIVKSLNQNAHRFSIEWARIEPEQGKYDEKEIEHYRKVLDALRERGIEPFVTLWHFTLPIWFSKMGGFENPESPEIFARYCEFVVKQLGDRAKYWITINEPMVYASNGYRKGAWPPFIKQFGKFIKVISNLATSHNIAYEKIKSINPNFQIGIAKNNIYFEYIPFMRWFWNLRFLNKISSHQDFIGLNYYFHGHLFGNKNEKVSDMGWEIFPKGIYMTLRELKRYNKPIFITENGLADAGDSKREQFIKDHLKWVHKAIQDGVNVQGYFYWSLLDNFEWAHGFKPCFGLVEINYETMERKIRPSAYEYARICEENRL